jgi:hypothetical protein
MCGVSYDALSFAEPASREVSTETYQDVVAPVREPDPAALSGRFDGIISPTQRKRLR